MMTMMIPPNRLVPDLSFLIFPFSITLFLLNKFFQKARKFLGEKSAVPIHGMSSHDLHKQAHRKVHRICDLVKE